jgi:hypothetical protein
MNDLSERLFRTLSHPNFLAMKGLANEVPIFIQTYEPSQEDAIRRMVDGLVGQTRRGHSLGLITSSSPWPSTPKAAPAEDHATIPAFQPSLPPALPVGPHPLSSCRISTPSPALPFQDSRPTHSPPLRPAFSCSGLFLRHGAPRIY